ncbi:MAG TPA: hypothetical protein VFZ65_15080 [Planctomycetota bacterium]|nr:hypothetical protein [Planctomycetota bacterium]
MDDSTNETQPDEPQRAIVHPSPDGYRAIGAPRPEQLDRMLAATEDAEALTRLQSFAAAHEDVARHCNLAFEEFARLAVFRLRVERKLGATLMQVVRRGGHRPRSTRLTSLASGRLPAGLSKQMAAKYRQLARIDEQVFDAYLRQAREQRRVPSANGARAFAVRRSSPGTPVVSRRVARAPALVGCVLDAVCRFLGSVQVCVGRADVRCETRLAPGALQLRQLHGSVLVGECANPLVWLPRLARGRLLGAFDEVLVVLPAAIGAAWFRSVAEAGWCCCFVASPPGPMVVTYHGPRLYLFQLAFRPLGAVLRSCTS